MPDTSKRLVWDKTGEHYYETGVKQTALYPQTGTAGSYGKGVAWNGVTAITESPSGAEANPLYADDTKYLNLISNEEFGATIEAYTYPDEFAQCDGSATIATGVVIGQQDRKAFGLCYKTTVGNDVDNNGYGYKLHIIYGATAAPSEKAYSTINDSPEAITFSWELNTTPVEVKIGEKEYKRTSCLTIDSTKVPEEKMTELENKLYGSETDEPTLLLPHEIAAIISA